MLLVKVTWGFMVLGVTYDTGTWHSSWTRSVVTGMLQFMELDHCPSGDPIYRALPSSSTTACCIMGILHVTWLHSPCMRSGHLLSFCVYCSGSCHVYDQPIYSYWWSSLYIIHNHWYPWSCIIRMKEEQLSCMNAFTKRENWNWQKVGLQVEAVQR